MNRFWKSMIGLIALVLFTGATINGQLIRAQLENLSSDPTGSTARVYYNTASNQPKIYNGTAWTSLGGSGNGEKNYITNGSSSATGWTASSGGATIATDTNTADLPDISVGSALLITAVSGSNAFTFYNFTLDPADYNKKLKTTFDQACGFSTASTAAIVSCASNDFKVDVYSCTVAWSGSPATTCSGTSTRLALSTDPSGSTVSALPALTGTYRTTFDSPGSAAQYLQLRIGMNATQTHAIALANVLVGPGIVTQGAAVTGWTSYTPTISGLTSTYTLNYAEYARVGEVMWIRFRLTTTQAGAGSGQFSLSSPTGTTFTGSSGNNFLADGTWFNATSGNDRSVAVFWSSGNGIFLAANYNLTDAALVGTSFGNGDVISLTFPVKIAEWAGAGTVNVVQNDCEYAFNTSTSDADDTTSFGYGPAGTAFPGALTSHRSKTVQWKTPASATDQITFEYERTTAGPWFPSYASDVNSGFQAQVYQGTVVYGVGVKTSSSTNTQVAVDFGQYAALSNSASYAAAGSSWTGLSGYQWRLKKCAGGQAVGFGQVTQTAAGLVASAGQLLGTNTNDSANTGNVGEFQSSTTTSTANTTSGTQQNLGSIVLTAGDWDISAAAELVGGSSTVPSQSTNSYICITTNNSSPPTCTDSAEGRGQFTFIPTITAPGTGVIYANSVLPRDHVSITSTTTYYMSVRTTYTGGAPNWLAYLSARRIR